MVVGKQEIRWHHADDVRRHAIQEYRSLQNVPVAIETTLPQPMADDHHGRGVVDFILGRSEQPSH